MTERNKIIDEFSRRAQQEAHYVLTKLLVKYNQKKLDSDKIRIARGNIKYKICKIAEELRRMKNKNGDCTCKKCKTIHFCPDGCAEHYTPNNCLCVNCFMKERHLERAEEMKK